MFYTALFTLAEIRADLRLCVTPLKQQKSRSVDGAIEQSTIHKDCLVMWHTTQWIKLMQLGVWHRIVYNLDSKPADFDRWLRSDSKLSTSSNRRWWYGSYFDCFGSNFDLFWLKDSFRDRKSWLNDQKGGLKDQKCGLKERKSQLNDLKSQFYQKSQFIL